MKTPILTALLGLAVAVCDARAQNLIDPPRPDQESRVGGEESRAGRDAWHGTVRLFFGAKALDEDDWEPVEAQGEFAILTNFGAGDWPVHLALDFRFAGSEEEEELGLEVVSSSWEVNLGIRKAFDTGSFVKPYIGGGLAIGGAALDIEIDDDSDAGIGFWIDGGIDFSLGGPVSLGFEIGYSIIPIELAGEDTDAGGFRIGLTLGFSW